MCHTFRTKMVKKNATSRAYKSRTTHFIEMQFLERGAKGDFTKKKSESHFSCNKNFKSKLTLKSTRAIIIIITIIVIMDNSLEHWTEICFDSNGIDREFFRFFLRPIAVRSDPFGRPRFGIFAGSFKSARTKYKKNNN